MNEHASLSVPNEVISECSSFMAKPAVGLYTVDIGRLLAGLPLSLSLAGIKGVTRTRGTLARWTLSSLGHKCVCVCVREVIYKVGPESSTAKAWATALKALLDTAEVTT